MCIVRVLDDELLEDEAEPVMPLAQGPVRLPSQVFIVEHGIAPHGRKVEEVLNRGAMPEQVRVPVDLSETSTRGHSDGGQRGDWAVAGLCAGMLNW